MEKAQKRSIIFLVVFLGFTGIIGLIFMPVLRDLQNPEYREVFSAWITGFGRLGFIVFFCIQYLQNLTAVIPVGGLLQVAAGAAFGLWPAFFILKACFILSTLTIFFIIRKFGSGLIIRLLGDDALDSWAFLRNEKNTSFVIFILFFIPGLPKDTMTYLIAMTKFPLYQFLPIVIIARFPAMFSGALMGDAVIHGNWVLFLLLFGFSALAGILGIQFRGRILKRLT